MLVLNRYAGEQLMIGDDIIVTVVSIKGHQVKIGIKAPRNITVHRSEVYERIQKERETA